jgi:response regulator of citrate/malate metabolism
MNQNLSFNDDRDTQTRPRTTGFVIVKRGLRRMSSGRLEDRHISRNSLVLASLEHPLLPVSKGLKEPVLQVQQNQWQDPPVPPFSHQIAEGHRISSATVRRALELLDPSPRLNNKTDPVFALCEKGPQSPPLKR